MSDLPSSTEVRAHVLGPAVAATLEIAIFHPLDTIAKRLMSHRSRLLFPGDVPRTLQNLRQVVYVDAVSFSPSRKIASLYPGLHFALTYKILQRVYKFGGQPVVKNVLYKSNDRWFMKRFGEKNGKIATDALAGALVGAGEVCLLPLDVLKIKAQTNPAVLKGKGLIELIVKENVKLYQGASWTVARNVPGSLCLFGGSAFIKENVFNPIHHSSTSRPYVMREYSLFETFVASAFGAFLAIVVSSPMDVVKTRLQNKDFGTTVRGSTVVAEIFRDEGIAAFSRGITPKLVTIGPKLVFSFTIAQYITAEMQKTLKH